MPCFQIPTKYYLCPEGSGSLDGKTKFTQRKQLPFTLVNTSLYTLHLTLNLNFFPLCFWFSHTAACAHFLRILWKGTAVTSMLSLKAFFSLLQINRRFRVSPSPTPTEGCLHHFFTSFAVGFIVVIFLLTKVLFCPSFSFLPRSCLHLHYPCPWQQVPILQLLSFLSLSVVAFALTPWGFTLI